LVKQAIADETAQGKAAIPYVSKDMMGMFTIYFMDCINGPFEHL
jgi:hypothetical protein